MFKVTRKVKGCLHVKDTKNYNLSKSNYPILF